MNFWFFLFFTIVRDSDEDIDADDDQGDDDNNNIDMGGEEEGEQANIGQGLIGWAPQQENPPPIPAENPVNDNLVRVPIPPIARGIFQDWVKDQHINQDYASGRCHFVHGHLNWGGGLGVNDAVRSEYEYFLLSFPVAILPLIVQSTSAKLQSYIPPRAATDASEILWHTPCDGD